MILDGSRKTMSFIVLLCNIKSPYSMEYNTIFVSKTYQISNQISNNLKNALFSLKSIHFNCQNII